MKREEGFLTTIGYYFSRQNLSVALLGFASGLPILMTLSTLTYWLSTLGVQKSAIGLASLLGLPYLLKFLWAPLLDLFTLPLLGRLGHRKGWILLFQLIIAGIFALLAFIDPTENPYLLGVLIFLLATASASLDIVVDAYRIDSLDEETQAYGASSYLFMYRIAMLLMGAGVLALSDFYSWSLIFQGVALLFLLIFLLTLLIKEPKREEVVTEPNAPLVVPLKRFMEGFVQFFKRDKALLFLLLVICYKLPDAVSGIMVTPFYHEMGYSGAEIGAVTKVYGLIATLLGAFLAATIIHKLGLYRSLVVSAILIGITNLGYLLIIAKPNLWMLIVAISGENFISGFSSALFIMFLGLLCDRNASATQYALLSALASFGLRVFGGASGFLAEGLGWEGFFISTAILFIPSLLLILLLKPSIVKMRVPTS
ncbi:MFS transporter [Ignatzschineria sp. F8392]|uniref:AmpG family muropeptide MFS transporter n=1 Tax=Ignatzschineria sp. F8392 TaxID=1980117 RepID=UPI001E57B644|nr:MFS transporter [Ignatzschineria sp. F8392]